MSSSSGGGGFLSASLMFIPLLAVPFLAAFGLPQFSPVAASSSTGAATSAPSPEESDPGVGESTRYTPDELFLDFEDEAAPPVQTATGIGEDQDWTDPFNAGARPGSQAAEAAAPRSAPNAPLGRTDVDVAQEHRVRPIAPESPAPSADAFADPAADEFPFEPAPQSPSVPEDPAVPSDQGEAPSSPELTWPAAVKRLKELGIHDFQLTPGQSDMACHFTCVFAHPDDPRVSYRFEAEAADPLQAVADVLRQIDERLARR